MSRPASVAAHRVITRVVISAEDRHLVAMTTSPRVRWTRYVDAAEHCHIPNVTVSGEEDMSTVTNGNWQKNNNNDHEHEKNDQMSNSLRYRK